MKARTFWLLILVLLLGQIIVFALSCGGDDDDDSSDSNDDTVSGDNCETITCEVTGECITTLGDGWGCSDGCCVQVGSDDDGGDDDDATDDDATDDDATDDDATDDDITDDDATDDVWTDSTSGLTWQVTPSSNYMTWDEAKLYCENLSLVGGGWRLPTISELRSLIRGCDATMTGGACGVTDDCLSYYNCWNDPCYGCDYLGGPGSGGAYWPDVMSGPNEWYWSSSPVVDLGSLEWAVSFYVGYIDRCSVDYYSTVVRCVR